MRSCLAGFTPAYAGNTEIIRKCRACLEVHPRIRGEYNINDDPKNRMAGSPPHTRGIQIHLMIIAAC